MRQFLEFEKPVAELENKIDELRQMTDPEGVNIEEETARLSDKAEKHLRTIYAKLTPWQKVQVARHAQRPHTQDYIGRLIADFTPLAGDRLFGDDKAIIGGIGRFDGMPVMVIGTERGSDLETRLQHNFGMARPEGYRKAQRLMKMAGQFNLPILTFIDTAGAWPGIDAEQRGQAEAIARSIATCFDAPVPLIATVIGEGGSGGAVALGAGDRVLMLEHAIYSVISPEACASILWRDPKQASTAAETLRLTAQDLKRLGLIDQIIPEPVGGAQRDPAAAMDAVRGVLGAMLKDLLPLAPEKLKELRREKFLAMGREALH
ncbi:MULTISPECIES: acetyl-CoA carboxylase carboxyltransferase subunit alpha [Acetobacter]|jgi:acetyl-CoA carboxylase carboxyl transferase subunit alpha|uniref:Acetyl-coenzyme A carboxylase carboxyl transferase subunit alpha n=1 Tax=Acetobacter lovaniensis TaxID=104100 RepID=A0A841QBT8_9PROT|nr:acetyl-CoA carboxylase carboxyltransferase subunit alpha [Acetobacter lovaniensis]MBB6455900.1 acetyl-CoA carboxylase carboxyl transferase subunit alpha [Acetobacter lovaniensis]MCI1697169.1 acetyl-CoA carboxylase carboxyltransferase subunit alpha [Acetobacter lovaniensis]MCI1795420.1 acetyl-CoA carboxylase carboxyltransferase subunit alpha [Acetobacter lovaniensis]MCP1238269.1 acetyl-CoA carboxylase carboxyltransferase subunit alpha [Acetobacter lovaniensis]NHN80293.1 acetyl-CoA carboxylas